MFEILKKLFTRAEPVAAETHRNDADLAGSCLSRKEAPDLETFSRKFVAANVALTKGNTDGLKEGIGLFIESLPDAGKFTPRLLTAIEELRCGLSHHDRADTKGPWNWDLSGYGVMSWKNDLYDRDSALVSAWSHIEPINKELRASGLGWDI